MTSNGDPFDGSPFFIWVFPKSFGIFTSTRTSMATFRDNTNILSKLSLLRIWNALQVVLSFYVSKWTKRAVHWGYPVSVSIEPTTSCNLRCPECPSGLRSFTRPTGMLQTDLFRQTLGQIGSRISYLLFYFQGEPYLNPQFLDMVKLAAARRIYTATSTNAHYLNDANAKATVESGLDRLIVSIDGTTQESYEQYRVGGDLQKVIEGTKKILHWKKQLKSKTPHVIFQFLVVQPNEHQLDEVQRLGKELGVDEVRFKTAQLYDYVNGNSLLPKNEKYARYKKMDDGSFRLKNAMDNHCWRLWHSTVITWDGKMVPCCFDKDAQHTVGDLQHQSFEQIWKGKELSDFRSAVLRSRAEIDICKNCSEGTKVWA